MYASEADEADDLEQIQAVANGVDHMIVVHEVHDDQVEVHV